LGHVLILLLTCIKVMQAFYVMYNEVWGHVNITVMDK